MMKMSSPSQSKSEMLAQLKLMERIIERLENQNNYAEAEKASDAYFILIIAIENLYPGSFL